MASSHLLDSIHLGDAAVLVLQQRKLYSMNSSKTRVDGDKLFVDYNTVRGDSQDLAVHLLQLLPPGLQLQELTGRDVAKVQGVEEEHQPMVGRAEVRETDVKELVILVTN